MIKPQTPNIKTFYKGQLIFKEDHESNVAYMVRKGAVNIFRTMNQKKVILDCLGEGEIFGEMGILAGNRRTANAEAAEFCELMVLSKPVLYNLLNQCPKTIQFLTKALIRRLEKTTQLIPDQVYESSFLSVCQLLELYFLLHQRMPMEERQRIQNYDLGLSYTHVCKQIKSIILVSQLEIDTILKKLHNLKVIEITNLKSQKAAFPERYITLRDPATFEEVTNNLHKELQKTSFSLTTEMEYVDIFEFAEEVETTPEMLYKKMSHGEVPETLLFVHKQRGLEWAEAQDPDFFKKVKKKKKSVDELEEIDDIVYVDNSTLKQVFEKLGYYKLGVLMALAEDDAKKKIMANLSRKIAQVVEKEAKGKEFVDDAEAEDVQDELFTLVRSIKGAGK